MRSWNPPRRGLSLSVLARSSDESQATRNPLKPPAASRHARLPAFAPFRRFGLDFSRCWRSHESRKRSTPFSDQISTFVVDEAVFTGVATFRPADAEERVNDRQPGAWKVLFLYSHSSHAQVPPPSSHAPTHHSTINSQAGTEIRAVGPSDAVHGPVSTRIKPLNTRPTLCQILLDEKRVPARDFSARGADGAARPKKCPFDISPFFLYHRRSTFLYTDVP